MWLEFILILLLTYISPIIVSPKHWIKFYVVYAVFGIFTAVIMYPIYLLNIKLFSRIVLRIILNCSSNCNIYWEVKNQETFKKQKCAVVVINHQSFIDFLEQIVNEICTHNLSWSEKLNRAETVETNWMKLGIHVTGVLVMNGGVQSITGIAKKELIYIFPVYLILKMYNCGFIDRRKPKESLQTMSHLLRKKDRKVCIFPEGTRNKHGNGLLPFKKGAFKVAIENKVPILPTVISPYYFIKQGEVCTEGIIKVSCLDPIETKGLQEKDIDDLMNKTRQLMEAELLKLENEVLIKHEKLYNSVNKKSI